jgi:ferredoxin
MGEIRERRFGDLTVRIDRWTCIASKNCTKVAPEVFEIDEENAVTFRENAPADVDRERLLEACRVCPVSALTVVAADGTVLVP